MGIPIEGKKEMDDAVLWKENLGILSKEICFKQNLLSRDEVGVDFWVKTI